MIHKAVGANFLIGLELIGFQLLNQQHRRRRGMENIQLPATAQTAINNTQTWLQKHERLIIVVLVIGLSLFVVQKYFDLSAAIESHKAQEATAVLQAQTDKTNNDLDTAKQLLSSYQAALIQSATENSKLADAIANRNLNLTTQQNNDKVLPPSKLADRWQMLTGSDNGDIIATSDGFSVSSIAAVTTVQRLEQVPVLEQNIADEQDKEKNLQTSISKANDLISQGKITVDGLQLQLQDQTKACNAQIGLVKAEARKSKMKWFFAGLITGFVGGKFW